MSFETALERTLSFEGWYSCDPDDRGGETFRGISRRMWHLWNGWPLIDSYKKDGVLNLELVKSAVILKDYVEMFYKNNYWLRACCEIYPDDVARVVFDGAVNVGVRRAIKWLQRSINVITGATLKVDGIPGPATTEAIMAARPEAIIYCMKFFRIEFNHQICEADPTQKKYISGWDSRALSA